jgi:hypothetical protein
MCFLCLFAMWTSNVCFKLPIDYDVEWLQHPKHASWYDYQVASLVTIGPSHFLWSGPGSCLKPAWIVGVTVHPVIKTIQIWSSRQLDLQSVGFEVLTAVNTKMAVFWIAVPCSLVEVYQRFRGPCCLHHHGSKTSEKLVNFYHTTTQKTAVLDLQTSSHFPGTIL